VTDLAAVTDRGHVREDNQDRYLISRSSDTTLFAVADGVGGGEGGEVASAAAVDALAGGFESAAADVPRALAAAMRSANDAVVRVTNERGHDMAASTLVAAAVRGRILAVANLGDSRAYLVRDRRARQITSDHSGPLANSITRFVGDPRGADPDVFVETLHGRDRVVLCSDGLTKLVEPDEIAATAGGRPPESAARALVDLANERGGIDNVTVVVYESPRVTLSRRALFVSAVAVGLLLGVAATATLMAR
jgi:PPM family protein phosphatase